MLYLTCLKGQVALPGDQLRVIPQLGPSRLVALVTPFRNGRVDLSTFERLVERQIAGGSHGIVVAGTTAEPSSLTVQERKDLLEVAVKTVSGRIPVVAATGSQSFAETAELTRHAEGAGAQAVLVVTPYYIKPPQDGLAEYFIGIGRLTRLPILIYHIPGRAAVSITAATIEKISAEIDHLVGMKHAAADLELVTETLKRVGAGFRIFCGLEALSFPMMAMGASGLMNAAGNIVPERIAALSNAVTAGDRTVDQGALARARDPCDHAQHPERDVDVHVLQVVQRGAADR